MKRKKQISIIVLLLLLSIFSTISISMNFESSENMIEQALEENNSEAEKDDKFFEKIFCKFFLHSQEKQIFLSQTISYFHLEFIPPFRPPIFS